MLKSIKAQDFKDYEIIVADANSKDKTREIARKYGCKVVQGGLPSKGRNNGARHASGEYFLFLDSDVALPPGFLRENLEDFKSKRLACAGVWAMPLSKKPSDRFIFLSGSFFQNALKKLKPFGIGWCIFITRKAFKAIKGFNEGILVGEDIDLTTRASKHGNFGVLKKKKVYVSVRRLEKEGRFNYFTKRVKTSFYDLIEKKMTVENNEVKYDFGGYDKVKRRKRAKKLCQKPPVGGRQRVVFR